MTMPDLPYPDLLPVLIYFGLLLYIGFKAKRRDAGQDEFLLGGRYLSIPAFVATLVATWYGGILGVGEFVYLHGISVWFVFGLPYYVFALLFAFFLAKRVRAAENYSIPDMLYRVYSKPVGILGSVFLLFMTSPAPYILTLAVLMQFVFHTGFLISVLAGTFFSMIYIYSGGFRSVVETDKMQFLFMFGGFMILFIFLLNASPPFSEIAQRLDAAHKSVSGGLSMQQILVWFMIASWTFIDPGFHQRCAAAKTPRVARNGILISVVFWFFFDMLTMSTGLYAAAFLPNLNPLMAYPQLAQQILPPFFKGLFFAGLLAIIMSTIDSYSFLSALTIGRDIIAQLKPESGEQKKNLFIKLGLMITALISIALIITIPSVVQLWYTIGSLFIPPLLLPLLAAYFPQLRISSRATLISMGASFLLSFTLFLVRQLNISGSVPFHLPEIEPFFPGFALSLVIFLAMKINPLRQNPGENL